MDPIAVLGGYVIWLCAFLAGGLTMLGLASVITRRMVFGLGYSDWSAREARQLGTICVVCGLAYGLYTLYGTLTLEMRLFPSFGTGYWWGVLVPGVPLVVPLIGGPVAGSIFGQHRKLAKRRSQDPLGL